MFTFIPIHYYTKTNFIKKVLCFKEGQKSIEGFMARESCTEKYS